MTWLNYINSEEGCRLATYGIEGDTYEMVDGKPKLTDYYLDGVISSDQGIKTELINKGVGVYPGECMIAGDMRMTWFGEFIAGNAANKMESVEEYKKLKPIRRFEGINLDRIGANFEQFTELNQSVLDATRSTEATQSAIFAETEDEARKTLEDFQEYIRNANGGLIKDYVDYVNKEAAKHDDIMENIYQP